MFESPSDPDRVSCAVAAGPSGVGRAITTLPTPTLCIATPTPTPCIATIKRDCTCFPQVMGGMGHLCTCARAPPSPYLGIRVANCAKIWCVARDPIVTRFTRLGDGVTTFARASPVSLSRKPLRPDIEATPKTDLSLSRSLVHRQTWRLTGKIKCLYDA